MSVLKHPADDLHIPIKLNSRADFMLKELLVNDDNVKKLVDKQVMMFLYKNEYLGCSGQEDEWIRTPPDEIVLTVSCRCAVNRGRLDDNENNASNDAEFS